jgi:hypothetical protein
LGQRDRVADREGVELERVDDDEGETVVEVDLARAAVRRDTPARRIRHREADLVVGHAGREFDGARRVGAGNVQERGGGKDDGEHDGGARSGQHDVPPVGDTGTPSPPVPQRQ